MWQWGWGVSGQSGWEAVQSQLSLNKPSQVSFAWYSCCRLDGFYLECSLLVSKVFCQSCQWVVTRDHLLSTVFYLDFSKYKDYIYCIFQINAALVSRRDFSTKNIFKNLTDKPCMLTNVHKQKKKKKTSLNIRASIWRTEQWQY